MQIDLFAVQQNVAHFFAKGSPPRLANNQRIATIGLQTLTQQLNLRALAATVDTFKGDKCWSNHDAECSRWRRETDRGSLLFSAGTETYHREIGDRHAFPSCGPS